MRAEDPQSLGLTAEREGWQARSQTEELGLRREEWALIGVSAVWLVALQFVEWPALLYPGFASNSSLDSAVFAYAGELLRHGGSPYLSYWDHKPPLVHFLNAAALTISHGQVWGIWLLSLSALLATLGLGYLALQRAFGRLVAVFGIAFFVFSLPRPLASNLTEQYVIPFQWGAVLLFATWRTRRRLSAWAGFWLGVLTAFAFLLRPNLIGASIAVALAWSVELLFEWRLREWMRVAGGGLVGSLAIGAGLVGYLALEGSLAAFWDQVVHYNVLYSSAPWTLRLRTAYAGMKFVGHYSPVLLSIAGWIVAAARVWRFGRSDPSWSVLLLSLVWFPLELFLLALPGREYGHYFMPLLSSLVLPTAVLATEIFSAMQPHQGARWLQPRALVMALVMAMALFPLADMILQLRDKGLTRTRMEQVSSTAQYLRTHTPPGSSIFVWGHAADVYFFSGRRPASRFIYALPLLTPGYADASLIRRFLEELQAAAPSLIVDATINADASAGEDLVPPLDRWDSDWRYPDPRTPRFSYWRSASWWTMTPALKAFYDFVSEHYRVAGTVGPLGWVIYERRAAAGDAETPR